MQSPIIAFRCLRNEGIDPRWGDDAIRNHLIDPDRVTHRSDETIIRLKGLNGRDATFRYHTPNGATVAEMACCAANAWDEIFDDMDVRLNYLLLQSDGSWLVQWFKPVYKIPLESIAAQPA